MLTTLLHRGLRRVLAPAPTDIVSRERLILATGLERLGDQARRGASPGHALTAPIIDRDVAAAVAAPAAAIAEELRDPSRAVDDDALADIRTFLTDGCTSSLFERDASDAFLAVADLGRRVRSDQPASGRKR